MARNEDGREESDVGEAVVRSVAGVFRCDGPKPRMGLTGTALGTLVLTRRHLMFLADRGGALDRRVRSSGADDVRTGLGSVERPAVDLQALHNPGSFAIPLGHVDGARAARRLDRTAYLALRLRDVDDDHHELTFMAEDGMPDAPGWARTIETARQAARR
jgi:hypothetical protein